MAGYFKYLGRALFHSFSKGWGWAAAMSTVVPFLFLAYGKGKLVENVDWLTWANDHQVLFSAYCGLAVFVVYLFYAPYKFNKDNLAEHLRQMTKRDEQIQGDEKEIAALRERLRPKFTLACGKDVKGSFTGKPGLCTNTLIGHGDTPEFIQCHYHRLAVTAQCEGSIKACGRIERIFHEEKEIWGDDEALLTFAPGNAPDKYAKIINDQTTAYLDVLAIARDGRVFMCMEGLFWRFTASRRPFQAAGKYTLVVLVTTETTRGQRAYLEIDWNNDWEGCELKLSRVELIK